MPGPRVVAIGRLGAAAEQQRLPRGGDDQRRAVGLAQIPVSRQLARHLFVVPGNGTVGLPDGLAGQFVEGNEILNIDAIKRQDKQVLEGDRG